MHGHLNVKFCKPFIEYSATFYIRVERVKDKTYLRFKMKFLQFKILICICY